MSIPNVNCFVKYYENNETLERYPERKAKYGEARKFYSCNQPFDYVTYVNTGTKYPVDYVDYSGNNEKSTGIFGKDGLILPKERRELKRKLRKTKSIIWDCVLTFKPEFGQRFCDEYEQAYNLMRKEFPRFLKNAGFRPDNITWYAGLHTNMEHRHIHISFFENEPTHIRANKKELQFSHGKIPQPCIAKFKLRAELCLTDVTAQLRVARKETAELCKKVLFSSESLIRYNNEFQSQIIRLISLLPEEGRKGYDSQNLRHLHPLIREIVDSAMKANPEWCKAFTQFCGEVKKQDDRIREILASHKIDQKYWNRYLNENTYLDDMYRRLGNQILNYARVYKKKGGSAKGRRARKRIRLRAAADVLLKGAQMQAQMETDAYFFFKEYLKKLENARQQNIEFAIEME